MKLEEQKEIDLRNGRIIGSDPLKTSLEHVLTLLVDEGKIDARLLKGVVIVIISDRKDLNGLSLITQNPDQNLLLWVPSPDVIKEYFRGVRESKKMRIVTGVSLAKIVNVLGEIALEAKEIQEKPAMTAGIEAEVVSRVVERDYDPAVLQLAANVAAKAMAVLQHDLKPYVIAEKGNEYRAIIAKARTLFAIKDSATDEQVVDFILKAKPLLAEEFKGKYLGELFCDLDDTLLMRDGTVNMEALAVVDKYERMGLPAHIWTGGDVEEARARVKGTVLERFRILSKYDYVGASAEVVIDNVSVEKFMLQYGIRPRKYVRV